MTNEEIFRKLRIEIVGDKPLVTLDRDPGKTYGAAWLILYHAETHAEGNFEMSAWRRATWGSSVKALMFPGFEKKLKIVKG